MCVRSRFTGSGVVCVTIDRHHVAMRRALSHPATRPPPSNNLKSLINAAFDVISNAK